MLYPSDEFALLLVCFQKVKTMYYYYSVLNIENVRCVVAIDNEYEAVLTMT